MTHERADLIVAKMGGSEGVDVEAVARDAAALHREGVRLVLVHGGSHATTTLAEQLGHPPSFITSPSGHTSRRTDARTLQIFQMACRGIVNQALVGALVRQGVPAVGLSGLDARIWEGRRKEAVRSVEQGRVVLVRDDYTGTVERVNIGPITALLGAGFMPVLSPPAVTPEGQAINVDADRAAAATAAALGAGTLLLLSNVPCLLARYPDESSLIERVDRANIQAAAQVAQGRMKKKVLGAGDALEAGVGRVVIADARRSSPIRDALAGAGTSFH
jgi:[amino group carrier protein]-L-2-aminoadipate 6-kinase